MTPQQLMDHGDQARLWPDDGSDAFASLPQAYQLALAVRALRCARGEQPRGYKVGFTNRNIWQRYGVFAPIWGTVWNSTLRHERDGQTLPLAGLCQPRIEPELVFAFRETPPAGASLDALVQALDWLAPGFEIVQSHRRDWKFTAAQTVADGALHGRLLVGQPVAVQDVAAGAADLHAHLAGARVQLHRDGVCVEEGRAAHVLDSPLLALQHFVQELRRCPGAPDIAPGDLVSTGTWTDAWPVQAGQRWTAVFDSGLPGLSVTFA